jgi:hypothetical protein
MECISITMQVVIADMHTKSSVKCINPIRE